MLEVCPFVGNKVVSVFALHRLILWYAYSTDNISVAFVMLFLFMQDNYIKIERP